MWLYTAKIVLGGHTSSHKQLQITVRLLFRTMGLPERDHADIRRKVILAVSTDKAVKGRNPEHTAAFKELSDFLTAEVAIRRKNPTDDLITHLAEAEIDGDRLSEREIVLTTATFVMAGVESLSSFMSMFALNLNDHPDARRRIVDGDVVITGDRITAVGGQGPSPGQVAFTKVANVWE